MLDPETIADTLSWTGSAEEAETADAVFAAECEAALRARTRPETIAAVEALTEAGRRRLLRAPEITRRLLFVATAPEDDLDALIRDAVTVEEAIAGAVRHPAAPLWSALGDVRLDPSGALHSFPQLAGATAVPLDFGSPHALAVDLTGELEINTAPRPALTDTEIAGIFTRVEAAMARLDDLTPTLPRFVAASTSVLVLQPDPASAAVASGTNGRYVGRSFIANPQSPDATLDCFAEAIVHEAIHGFLFREALRRPWVNGEAAMEVKRIPSPWTGRPLPVRSYLEAACVWYGLVHLWSLALQGGGFDTEAVKTRLIRSVDGFNRGSLIERVRPFRNEIRPDVLTTVDTLQSRIVEALGERAA